MHFGVRLWSQSEAGLQHYSAKLMLKPLLICDLSFRISVITFRDITLSPLV